MHTVKAGGGGRTERGGEGHSEEDMTPKYNIKREHKTIEEVRKDKNRIILSADKGLSMEVMDREDYIRKAEELLSQPTYKPIPTDPTTK